jgi:hypothetical protein
MRIVSLFLATLAVCTANAQVTVPTVALKATIGCESCGDATQFGTIWDVSVSTRGQLLVTEKNAPMLRLFDTSGKVVWTGGRSGKGPGEYLMPYRSSLTDGGIQVVDMTNARITDLSLTGELLGSVPLTGFSTTVGVNPRGELILGMDGRNAFKLARRAPRADKLDEGGAFPGSMKNKAIALAPDGSMAVALDIDAYEITRLDASGKVVGIITRQLERPRRTLVEENEQRQRLNRNLEQMSVEMKRIGGSGKATPLAIPVEERGLKPHLAVDGLRYDGANRLWVRTMRGDETKTIFDVFSPAGGYVGSVTLPSRITAFSVAGGWLATAGESEDGIPEVKLWTVK